MNFNFYIFATPMGRYSQYPDDYIAPTLLRLQKNLSGSRLVIFREMDLVHYVYYEKIDGSGYVGFCVIFNGIRITKPKKLIQYFRQLVENSFVKEGNFIRYDENGSLKFNIKEMREIKTDYDAIRKRLEKEFANNRKKYGIEELNSSYNGLKNSERLNESASDDEITKLTDKYNKVIIDSNIGIENGYLPQLMTDLRERLSVSNQKISQLNNEIEILNKKKKQYKYVVSLFLIVILCCVGLYLFYNEVIHKKDKIKQLEKTIVVKNDSIKSNINKIESLDNKVQVLNSTINALTNYSFSTGATLRNNDSSDNGWIMWLHAKRKVQLESFFVKGGSSSNGEITLALYDSNDNLIATVDAYVSSSEFKRINLGTDWNMKSGYYYLRIKEPNGKSLQYHGSNDKEYSQFSGGALEVTGCSSYGDRTKLESRNNHGYYQYFYNIQYKIVE